ISLSNTTVQVGQVQQGLNSAIRSGVNFLQCVSTFTSTGSTTSPLYGGANSTGSPMRIRIQENFATAFRVKNIAQILTNGTLAGTNYAWNGGTAYPADNDQNVPGAVYGTETGFYFPSTGSTADPVIAPCTTGNPPCGFGTPVTGTAVPGNR